MAELSMETLCSKLKRKLEESHSGEAPAKRSKVRVSNRVQLDFSSIVICCINTIGGGKRQM